MTANIRKLYLRNNSFTIISNNCWGGFIYQSYKLSYATPTIGLFFMAEDYIKFLSKLDYYLEQTIIEVPSNSSKWNYKLSHKNNWGYPIGRLDDIEIHFLHYESIEEAKTAWIRRCKRINRKNLLVKFCDQNECSYKYLKEFDSLPFANKICFSVTDYPELESVICVGNVTQPFVLSTQEPFGKSRYIDINNFLNNLKVESI